MSILRALSQSLRRSLVRQSDRYNARLLADLGLKR